MVYTEPTGILLPSLTQTTFCPKTRRAWLDALAAIVWRRSPCKSSINWDIFVQLFFPTAQAEQVLFSFSWTRLILISITVWGEQKPREWRKTLNVFAGALHALFTRHFRGPRNCNALRMLNKNSMARFSVQSICFVIKSSACRVLDQLNSSLILIQ